VLVLHTEIRGYHRFVNEIDSAAYQDMIMLELGGPRIEIKSGLLGLGQIWFHSQGIRVTLVRIDVRLEFWGHDFA
jgi:hypothetical protein